MPTIFIALQCCQCFTMQVKQQKKSSNKWSCVVCNQKQTVRTVYAQGFLAKDVRKFVQSFNTSRQLDEENQLLEDDRKETLEIEDQFTVNLKKKRTDWSEYIDPPEEDNSKSCHGDETIGDDEFGTKIVTEIPKAVFKKPKLKNYPDKFTGDEEGDEFESKIMTKLRNNFATVSTSADQVPQTSRWPGNRLAEAKEFQPTYETSKWKSFSTQDDNKFEKKVPCRSPSVIAKSASKWSCYIIEDSDDLLPASGRALKVQADAFEINKLNDQKVEEDIHPDFL